MSAFITSSNNFNILNFNTLNKNTEQNLPLIADTFDSFFPVETSEDRFLFTLYQKKIIDENGSLLNPKQFRLPLLSAEEKKIISSFLSSSISIVFSKGTSKEPLELKIDTLLNALYEKLNGPTHKFKNLEIIGGMVFWLLKDYFSRATKELFSLEANPSLSYSKPLDIDFRCGSIKKVILFEEIKNFLIQFIAERIDEKNLDQEKFAYYAKYPNPLNALVKNECFTKLKLVGNEENFFEIIGFGNRRDFSLELNFYAQLERCYLFRRNALPINIFNYISKKDPDYIEISERYCSGAQVLCDWNLKNIFVELENAHAIDLMIVLSRMTRNGERCLQKNILGDLCNIYFKEQSLPFSEYSKNHLKHIFSTHHSASNEQAKALLLNFCFFFFDKKEIHQKELLELWNWNFGLSVGTSQNNSLWENISSFLNSTEGPFSLLSSWIQMAGFITLYLSNGTNATKEYHFSLTKHNGSAYLRLEGIHSPHHIFIKFNLSEAINKIKEFPASFPHELLELLLPAEIDASKNKQLLHSLIEGREWLNFLEIIKNNQDKFLHYFEAISLSYSFDKILFQKFLEKSVENPLFFNADLIAIILDPFHNWKNLPEIIEKWKEQKADFPDFFAILFDASLKEGDNKIIEKMIPFLEQKNILKTGKNKLYMEWIKMTAAIDFNLGFSLCCFFRHKRYFGPEQELVIFMELFHNAQKRNEISFLPSIYIHISQIVAEKNLEILPEKKEQLGLRARKIVATMIESSTNLLHLFDFINHFFRHEIFQWSVTDDLVLWKRCLEEIFKLNIVNDSFFLEAWNHCSDQSKESTIQQFPNFLYFISKIQWRNGYHKDGMKTILELIKLPQVQENGDICHFIHSTVYKIFLQHPENKPDEQEIFLLSSFLSKENFKLIMQSFPQDLWSLHYILAGFYHKNLITYRPQIFNHFESYIDSFILTIPSTNQDSVITEFSVHIRSTFDLLIGNFLILKKIEEKIPLLLVTLLKRLYKAQCYNEITYLLKTIYLHRLKIDIEKIEEIETVIINSFGFAEPKISSLETDFFTFLLQFLKNEQISFSKPFIEQLVLDGNVNKAIEWLEKLKQEPLFSREFYTLFGKVLDIPFKAELSSSIISIFKYQFPENLLFLEKFVFKMLEEKNLLAILIKEAPLFKKTQKKCQLAALHSPAPLLTKLDFSLEFKIFTKNTYFDLMKEYKDTTKKELIQKIAQFYFEAFVINQDLEFKEIVGIDFLVKNLGFLSYSQLILFLNIYQKDLLTMKENLKEFPQNYAQINIKNFGCVERIIAKFISCLPIYKKNFTSEQHKNIIEKLTEIVLFNPYDAESFGKMSVNIILNYPLTGFDFLKSILLTQPHKRTEILGCIFILVSKLNAMNEKNEFKEDIVNSLWELCHACLDSIEETTVIDLNNLNISLISLQFCEFFLKINSSSSHSLIVIKKLLKKKSYVLPDCILNWLLKEINSAKRSANKEYPILLKEYLEWIFDPLFWENINHYIRPNTELNEKKEIDNIRICWKYAGIILSCKNTIKFTNGDQKLISDYILKLNTHILEMIKNIKTPLSFTKSIELYINYFYQTWAGQESREFLEVKIEKELISPLDMNHYYGEFYEIFVQKSISSWREIIFLTLNSPIYHEDFSLVHKCLLASINQYTEKNTNSKIKINKLLEYTYELIHFLDKKVKGKDWLISKNALSLVGEVFEVVSELITTNFVHNHEENKNILDLKREILKDFLELSLSILINPEMERKKLFNKTKHLFEYEFFSKFLEKNQADNYKDEIEKLAIGIESIQDSYCLIL